MKHIFDTFEMQKEEVFGSALLPVSEDMAREEFDMTRKCQLAIFARVEQNPFLLFLPSVFVEHYNAVKEYVTHGAFGRLSEYMLYLLARKRHGTFVLFLSGSEKWREWSSDSALFAGIQLTQEKKSKKSHYVVPLLRYIAFCDGADMTQKKRALEELRRAIRGLHYQPLTTPYALLSKEDLIDIAREVNCFDVCVKELAMNVSCTLSHKILRYWRVYSSPRYWFERFVA